MAWQEPKTDWEAKDGVMDIDLSRMEENTLSLKEALDEGRANNWQ